MNWYAAVEDIAVGGVVVVDDVHLEIRLLGAAEVAFSTMSAVIKRWQSPFSVALTTELQIQVGGEVALKGP